MEKVCGVYVWVRARPWYIHSCAILLVVLHYSSRCTLVRVFGFVSEAIIKPDAGAAPLC